MTSAEGRLEERLRSGLREVAESVTFEEGGGFIPSAPPTTTPSWRRRRTLFLATASVSLVLVVAVVAMVIRSAQPARDVSVNPTTVPNAQPSGSLLPIATEKIFPGLSHVMQRVHDYERADGPVAYGEIVETTLDKTDVLFGSQHKFDTSPVYAVRLVGTFTCNTCSTPPHAVAPHGSEIVFTYSRVAGVPLGMFQIGNGPTDLSQFGRVYRLPGAGSSSSSNTLTTTPTCRVTQLQASGSWQGAGGMMGGSIYFANVTGRPCLLSGRPTVQVLGAKGERLHLDVTEFRGIPISSVTLKPHVAHGALVTIVWQNWCDATGPVTVRVLLPHSDQPLAVRDDGFSSRPRCDNPKASSGLAVGPFQTPQE
jgi:hypothetical protein